MFIIFRCYSIDIVEKKNNRLRKKLNSGNVESLNILMILRRFNNKYICTNFVEQFHPSPLSSSL